MKFKAGVAAATAVALLGVPAMLVAGCQSAEQVAAANAAVIINGKAIAEDTITEYIQSYRTTNALQDDTEWAQWLANNGYEASSLRDETIDYYIRQTVIEQDAEKRNIVVTDEEVDAQIAEVRGYYGYDDTQWEDQLAAIGYTTESYRDYIKQSLIQEKLVDAISEGEKADDGAILSLANSYGPTIDGSKYLKYIFYETAERQQAEQALADIREHPDRFEAIAAERGEQENSTGKDGWDCLTSVESPVADAVAQLDQGGISDIVEGNTGLYIVKVAEICHVPAEGFTDINQMPEALREEFARNAAESSKYSAFQTYIDDLIASSVIERKDMPEGLPYDVSTEGLTSPNESEVISTETMSDEEPDTVETDDEKVSADVKDDTSAEQAQPDESKGESAGSEESES